MATAVVAGHLSLHSFWSARQQVHTSWVQQTPLDDWIRG